MIISFSLQTVEHLQGLDKFLYCFIEGSQNVKLAIMGIPKNYPKLQYLQSSSANTLRVLAVWEDGILQLKPFKMYGFRLSQLFQASFAEFFFLLAEDTSSQSLSA